MSLFGVASPKFLQRTFRSLQCCSFKLGYSGISLVSQWLRLLLLQGVLVQSLVGELRSHVLCCVAKIKKNKNKQKT